MDMLQERKFGIHSLDDVECQIYRRESIWTEDDSSHQEGPIDCTNDDTLVRQDDGVKRVKIKNREAIISRE